MYLREFKERRVVSNVSIELTLGRFEDVARY